MTEEEALEVFTRTVKHLPRDALNVLVLFKHRQLAEQIKKTERVEAWLFRCQKALHFYAEMQNYKDRIPHPGLIMHPEMVVDQGEIAREALKIQPAKTDDKIKQT